MANKSFEELAAGYINSRLTKEDLARFIQLIQQEQYEQQFKKIIEQLLVSPSYAGTADQQKAGGILPSALKGGAIQNGLTHCIVNYAVTIF